MSPPYMQLYVGDYLGDTRHLTTEQHGAYMLLLMTMWRADGRLPNDDRKLARIVGCTASRWSKIRTEVMEFFEVEGEFITNERLLFELEKASEKSIKRAEVGSKGGKSKSLKNKETTEAIATGLLYHSSEPEPYIEKRDTKVSLKKNDPPPDRFDDFWRTYPRKIGKPKAEMAWQAACKRAPPDAILAGLNRWRQVWTDPNFTPHPTTWLNRDGWADEIPEAERHDRSYQNPRKSLGAEREDSTIRAFRRVFGGDGLGEAELA